MNIMLFDKKDVVIRVLKQADLWVDSARVFFPGCMSSNGYRMMR